LQKSGNQNLELPAKKVSAIRQDRVDRENMALRLLKVISFALAAIALSGGARAAQLNRLHAITQYDALAFLQQEFSVEGLIRRALLGEEGSLLELSAVRFYAMPELLPAFAWDRNFPANVFDLNGYRFQSASLFGAFDDRHLFKVELLRNEQTLFGQSSVADGGFSGMSVGGVNFSSGELASTIFAQIDEKTQIGLSAIVAYQKLAPLAFGLNDRNPDYSATGGTPFRDPRGVVSESAYGAGVQLGLNGEVVQGLRLAADYRSRIGMGAFDGYRSVFLQPGEFDIPAMARLGMALQPLQSTELRVDVRRVLYSQVQPFVGAQLPTRVLALLGDSDSPEFAWRDLTVISVGLDWQVAQDWKWRMEYSTSYQPSATSRAISNALATDAVNDNFSVGLSHVMGENGHFDFSARYNGDLVGGLPYYLRRPDQTHVNNIQLQAIWSWGF